MKMLYMESKLQNASSIHAANNTLPSHHMDNISPKPSLVEEYLASNIGHRHVDNVNSVPHVKEEHAPNKGVGSTHLQPSSGQISRCRGRRKDQAARKKINPNQRWTLAPKISDDVWPQGSSPRIMEVVKPLPKHPRISTKRHALPGETDPLIRQPPHKRRGRPHKNPLSMLELQERLGEDRVKQGDRSLKSYLADFTASLNGLGDPIYEKDVAKLFIDGLRSDVYSMVRFREDRFSLDCLNKAYRAARHEDFGIRHPRNTDDDPSDDSEATLEHGGYDDPYSESDASFKPSG